MDALFIGLGIVAAVALRLGYKWGWNNAVTLYERRSIEQAHNRAEQDRL